MKSEDQTLARPIPHLYQSFIFQAHADRDGLGEGTWALFEEINTVIEDDIELAGIRDAEPREKLQNLTYHAKIESLNTFVEGHCIFLF